MPIQYKLSSDIDTVNGFPVFMEGAYYNREEHNFGNISRWVGKNSKINFIKKETEYVCKLSINNKNPNNTFLFIKNSTFNEMFFLKVGRNFIEFSTKENYIEIEAEEINVEYNKEYGVLLESLIINKKQITVINEIKSSINLDIKCALKYIGQTGTCGYASAAKGYIADYVLKTVPISWQPLQFDDSKNDKNYYVDALCESVINKSYEKYEKAIFHSTPDLWSSYLESNKDIDHIIGYCAWETNKLPNEWVKHINIVPEVWVPSIFNKQSFIDSGVKAKIKVVPHIWHKQSLFDKNDIHIYDNFENLIPKNKFTYYSIGELNFRKGIEDLVSVFDKFNNDYPDTQLILKLHYKNYSEENKKYCIDKIKSLTSKIGTSIFLIFENLTNEKVLALHSFGDCYVSLNKGEGFGLTIFDAFNLGKKIITTGYGGQIDYLGKDYEGLVDFKINKVTGMENFSTNYSSDQEWAYPDLDHSYELIKKFYEC